MDYSQGQDVESARAAYLHWISEYGIHAYLNAEPPGLEQARSMDSEIVWTEFQNDLECFVTSGFAEPRPDMRMPVVGYYLASRRIGEERPLVVTIFTSECNACGGSGEIGDDECERCWGSGQEEVDFGELGEWRTDR